MSRMAPLFHQSVGFDRFADLFERAWREDANSTYPPYDIEKHGSCHYRIVVAAAGLDEHDLEVRREQGVLRIAGQRRAQDPAVVLVHQGIARRAFRLYFRLADRIEVRGARLARGLLTVELEYLPEHDGVQLIPVMPG